MNRTSISDTLQSNQQQANQLEITYFTDPLCCWSWAFEPHWRKLLEHFSGKVSYRYCMSGLLPDWKTYNDPVNYVSKPIQMGPVWMHASQLSGTPIKNDIWFYDPPASSYPACIAVKCATLQSPNAGEAYLSMARQAVMVKGENIARTDVLHQLAERLQQLMPTVFSAETFKLDMSNDNGIEAFREDLDMVKLSGIDRYPSLLIRYSTRNAALITGYKPYEVLVSSIEELM